MIHHFENLNKTPPFFSRSLSPTTLVSELQRSSAVHHVEDLLFGEGIVVDADIVKQ